jgi:signal transduction histidine kinase
MPKAKTIPAPVAVLVASLLGGAVALLGLVYEQHHRSCEQFQAGQLELATALAKQLEISLQGAVEGVETVPLAEIPMDDRVAADIWLANRPEVNAIFGSTSVVAVGPDRQVLASLGSTEHLDHHPGEGLTLCTACLASSRVLVVHSPPDEHGCTLEVQVSVDALSREFVQPLQGSSGYAWVLGPERTVVAAPDLNHIGTRPFEGALDSSLHAMLVDMEAGGRGTASYMWQEQERLAAYVPVDIEGQFLAVAVSAEAGQVTLVGTWWRIAAVLLVMFTSAGASILLLRRAEQQRFEERLRLEQAAAHADRLVMLGTLSAGVAHELRGPLCALVLGLDLLDTMVDDPLLQDMHEAADRLTQLTHDMTRFSRSRSAEAQCSPADALSTALRMGAPRLRTATADIRNMDLPPVAMQRQRLEQVLLNLLVNAADSGATSIVVAGRVEGDTAELTVSDNGPGIAPEARGRLFQAFVTTKPDGEGTGLGLFLCQRLMQDVGGHLTLQDSEIGACFRVTLPLSPEQPEAGTPPPSRSGRRTGATAPPRRRKAPRADSDAHSRSTS